MVYKQCVESTVKTVIGRKGDNNKKHVFKEMAQKVENLVRTKNHSKTKGTRDSCVQFPRLAAENFHS